MQFIITKIMKKFNEKNNDKKKSINEQGKFGEKFKILESIIMSKNNSRLLNILSVLDIYQLM